MATLRIDQATPGPGTDGQSRHDLIPGEVITLVATAPTGPGITYTWEILDKAGSTAVLSATTGISVSIGLAAAITQPCAFLIKLTVNDNGTVTETVRIASVRTLSTALRLPLFPETAPTSGRLNSNTPDQSTDNAYYPNRAGTGAAGQNWRGWSEWAYELTLAVEAAAGGGGGGPTGPATGDLSGTYPSPLVVGLQGVPISAVAPTNGQVLQYNSGTLQWEPTTLPTSAGPSVFVYQEGGTPGGNIYATWASLYTAVNAVAGPKQVFIDGSAGTPEVSAGSYDFSDWTFVGQVDTFTGLRPTLTVRTGVTISGNFRAVSVVLLLDAGASSPIVVAGSSYYLYELVDAEIDGGGGNGFIAATTGGPPVRITMRGRSRVQQNAILSAGAGGNFLFDAHDQAQIDSDAVSGSVGSVTVALINPATVILEQLGFSGTITVNTPIDVFNGPLDATQLGTTELHIGSIYLTAGTRLLAECKAMLGGSAVSDTGNLRMRRFTGATIVLNWQNVGALASVDSTEGETLISDTDWYDLYLYAGGAAETAIVKGLRLIGVKES